MINGNEPGPSSLLRRCANLLHHVAGAAPDDLRDLDQRTRMQYGTLGGVFLLNLLLLSAAWIKVGLSYFGAIGIVVPGLAVPALFVLGLDRLVAMRHRRLSGELEGFNLPGATHPRWELRLRVGSALALAALTTFTFMMTMSVDSIRQVQDGDARAANAPVRQEYLARIRTTHDFRNEQANKREALLLGERATLDQRIEAVEGRLVEHESKALRHREEAAMEAGGLGYRQLGAGPRYNAQVQIAQQNDAAVEGLRMQQRQAVQARQAIDTELRGIRASQAAALAEKNQALAALDEDVRIDERFVAPRRGLFADATAFVRLYADPAEAAGRWLLTLLIVAVLFALESAALIALELNPSSPLDVLRMARNRELSAWIVAKSESDLAAVRAASPSLYVYEPTMAAEVSGSARGANAGTGAEPDEKG